MDIEIRLEQESDYRAVEEVTREAFWNLYVPGCDEHYLAHQLRASSDFIPELDFVAVFEGSIIGSIMFSKSSVVDENGVSHDTITFGPVSVLPEYQAQGVGKALINHAIGVAAELGYRAILIYGDPEYYFRFGFQHAKDFGISNADGQYPAAHMALPLYPGALDGIRGKAYESEIFGVDESEAEEFGKSFAPKEKCITESQKWFEQMASTFL